MIDILELETKNIFNPLWIDLERVTIQLVIASTSLDLI